MKYGQPAPLLIGGAWFILFLVGFKASRYFSDGNYGVLFFTFCDWSLKTVPEYYLSFIKVGFLIGNMRVSVGFYIYVVAEANLPSLALCVFGMGGEDGSSCWQEQTLLLSPSHVAQICADESELQGQFMPRNQLDTSEGSHSEKH